MTRKREPVQTYDYAELTMNGVTVPIHNLSAKISPVDAPPAKPFPSSVTVKIALTDKLLPALRELLASLPPPPDSVDVNFTATVDGERASVVRRVCFQDPPFFDVWEQAWGLGQFVEGPRLADGRWSRSE